MLITHQKKRTAPLRPFLWVIAGGLVIKLACAWQAPPAPDKPQFTEPRAEREKQSITVDIDYPYESTPSPDGQSRIVFTDVSSFQPRDIRVQNNTDYAPDFAALLEEPLHISPCPEGSGPSVLIVHTHGSEAYTPTDNAMYTPTDTDRTTDTGFNVVRVGDLIEKRLTEAGIGVIHDRTLYDYPRYTGAYTRALEGINGWLAEYPSLCIVLDIHRDALNLPDGSAYARCCTVEGTKCAQILIVSGTDEDGLEHPRWQENLKLALQLERVMDVRYPGLLRSINLRSERFNQHATPGSLIIEVGCNGNTLEEALAGAGYFSDCAAEVILRQTECIV